MDTYSDRQGRTESLSDDSGGAGRGRSIVLGILLIVVGLVALSSTATTAFMSVLIVGAALAVAGFVEIFHSLGRGKHFQPLRLLGGLLSVVVGFLFVMRPAVGINALSLLLAAYFFASGLFHTVTSVAEREPRWGWDFAYGLCALVLGVIAVSAFPEGGMWLIGTLVGLEILLRGITMAAVGLHTRRALRTHRHVPA